MNAVARILTASEPWVEYQLDDGTLLRFRFTACSFRKTGKETAQGDPEYAFSQSLLCETHVPKVVAEVRQLPRFLTRRLLNTSRLIRMLGKNLG